MGRKISEMTKDIKEKFLTEDTNGRGKLRQDRQNQ